MCSFVVEHSISTTNWVGLINSFDCSASVSSPPVVEASNLSSSANILRFAMSIGRMLTVSLRMSVSAYVEHLQLLGLLKSGHAHIIRFVHVAN